jgi:four helix bundle protein
MKIRNNFEDLKVWQYAINLTTEIYNVTNGFPKEEIYGLTNQIRRASVSIASNIAEGASRKGKIEFVQFLSIAQGSLAELKTQLVISNKINHLNDKDFESLINSLDEISKMLGALKRSISNN